MSAYVTVRMVTVRRVSGTKASNYLEMVRAGAMQLVATKPRLDLYCYVFILLPLGGWLFSYTWWHFVNRYIAFLLC